MTLADPNKQAFCNVLKFTMMSNFLNQCSKFLLTLPNVPMMIGIMMMIIIIIIILVVVIIITPSVISGNSLRPDLLLTVSKKCLYILELTVGFETNL